MLDLPSSEKVMHGVRMELEDCAFKSLQDVQIFTDQKAAFADNDVIVMLANSMELKADMTRAQLLKENLRVYKETSKILLETKNKDIKVLMVANPANTNCMLLIESLKGSVAPENLTCLTRLDHNRSKFMITMYGFEIFLFLQFGLVSLSAASAAIDHLRNWLVGTEPEDWVSMGVYTDPIYDAIPKGVVFGQPCTAINGNFKVVKGLKIDDFTRKMMQTSANELLAEKQSLDNIKLETAFINR
ncbi:hypothetical protein MXB_4295 [Myxobolus squamalis]|nr:hypothetical protein MXB_4295 [Myxobolus squamalis]